MNRKRVGENKFTIKKKKKITGQARETGEWLPSSVPLREQEVTESMIPQ